ncbi:hypothetical protein OIU77_026267 [Salix suchowensis]|uniref:Uncharacterized protein n=1 Tax=Salix suchowensis TaxID=1278906 RepID=A0ABQ9BZ38_9ROSI|nr:hypothetical protein OIU77_026267 [Salix suchowensis]
MILVAFQELPAKPSCSCWAECLRPRDNFHRKKLMEPAVTGTRNVLKACSRVELKKAIVVPSMLAKGSSDE